MSRYPPVGELVDPPAGGLLSKRFVFSVYAIYNNGKIYIGHTADLGSRLQRHNGILKNKKKSYTSKNKGVWELIYKEEFKTRQEAIKREKELKSFRGREFVRGQINKGR
ncbi:MAG: GIY-YIG nuclease family protein [Patescibacteria group bacterium]